MEERKECYYDILVHGGSLQRLCNLTAEYLHNPVAITLTTRTIIRKSPDYTRELTEEYSKAYEFLEVSDTVDEVIEMNRLLLAGEPFSRVWVGSHHKRINCGCFLEGELAAVVDCPIVNGSLPEDAMEIVKMAAEVFVAALRMNGFISRDMRHPLDTYLAALLRGEVLEGHQMRNFYESHLDKPTVWQLFWLSPGEGKRAEQIRALVEPFCRANTGFYFCSYQDGYVVLMDAEYKRGFDLLLRMLRRVCYVSVSEQFTDLLHCRKMLSMAKRALKLAQAEGAERDVVFVEMYKVPLIYLSGYRKPLEGIREQSLIGRIKAYDAEHDSEFYQTVRVWLLNKGSAAAVAEKLNIHKNTVAYRIRKLEEIFGISLKDCHVITALYLSLLVELTGH
ncbi:MAG: helix-turn-helix domain-containing protein [Elusimicrobiales bacterium]|nr:helix-turn-helix domain-containing protein [Elusimicrobiales bacterium]